MSRKERQKLWLAGSRGSGPDGDLWVTDETPFLTKDKRRAKRFTTRAAAEKNNLPHPFVEKITAQQAAIFLLEVALESTDTGKFCPAMDAMENLDRKKASRLLSDRLDEVSEARKGIYEILDGLKKNLL